MTSGPLPLVIGWKEYLDFPEWGVHRVRVKIDTGAKTSALGVAGCEVVDGPAGPVAHVRLALNRRYPERVTVVETPVLQHVTVCSTCGNRELRPVIEARVRLGPVEKSIRLTLTRRDSLRHRIILGRQALAGTFVVDVSRKFLLKDRR